MPEANFRVYSLAAMCMRAELHILLHDSAYYVCMLVICTVNVRLVGLLDT